MKEALAGARDILTEGLAEDAALLGRLRAFLQQNALLTAKVVKGQEEKGAKFSDYFAHSERWAQAPSHRALAMMRGANEGVLTLDIGPDPETGAPQVEAMVTAALGVAGGGAPGDRWLADVARWAWRTRLSVTMMLDLLGQLRERAQDEAIRVFARNLRDLLLAAPAGPRPTMGLDPGVRTGVKVAVVDATGKLLATDTVYPFQPKNDVRGAQAALAALIRRHGVELVAIGNGTASRETEKLVAEMLAALPAPKPTKVIVSEAGASVYSASELAGEGVPRPRRLAARRGLDRPAAAGPAGRARQDRAEGDRRRPVPARRRPAPPRALARGGGRGCGERGRRRSQHGLGAAARACLGPRAVARRGDRRPPQREGRLPQPQGPARRAAPRPAGLRAMRRLPAHPRRHGAARRLGGASRSLRPRPAHRRRLRARPARAHGRRGAAEGASTRRTSSTGPSACRRCATSSPSSPSPAAIRGPASSPRASPRASTTSGT